MRYFILFLFLFVLTVGFTQTYKPFSVRIGLGSLIGRYNGGAALQLEPSYGLNDKFLLGMRLESMSGALKGQSALVMRSFGVNVQRYFLSGKIRPYAGIGAAFYSPELTPGGRCNCTYGTGSGIPGFYPRIGLDFDHMFLSLEYNFISSSQVEIHDQFLGTNSKENLDFSYMSIKAGIMIGGGRRKN